MKKILALILSLLMVMMLLTSCGANSEASNDSYSSNGNYKTESAGGSMTESPDSSNTPAKDAETVERKVIKTYRIRMETLLYDEAVAKISSATEQFGGYIAEATQDGTIITENGRKRTATYTIRVPAERADAYIEHISNEYNVLSSSLSTEDVTDSYYTIQSRLDSLVIQEERLTEMLKQAKYLDEMLQLEDKLSQVRAEINGLHTKLQLMDKSVEYSYVYVTLYEVKEYVEPEKETYLARLGSSFVDAFQSFTNVVGELFIIFIWLLPYIIVIGIAVIMLLFIAKKDKQRKDKAKQKERTAQNEKEENK